MHSEIIYRMAMTTDRCCYGCSLRTGTIIIAVFLLVCSVLTTLSSSFKLHSISTLMDDQEDNIVEFKNQFEKIYQRMENLKAIFIGVIVSGAVKSILNALLLIGVLKEKRILVIIWLVAYAVICVLALVVFVLSFFQFATYRSLQIGIAISIGLYLYFLLVVLSFYNSPETGHNRQRNAADVYDTENCNIKRMPL